MTPQTIEALIIAAFCLLGAAIVGIRVGMARRPPDAPLELYRPGDAWVAKGRRR
jgi:hypothetical protein